MKIVVKAPTSKITRILQGWSEIALKKATTRSVNRAAVSIRKEATKLLKEKYNLPTSGGSKGGEGFKPPGIKPNIVIQNAKYSRKRELGEIHSIIRVSSKPISLIHFVKGDKTPMDQRGIPVSKRTLLKVQITRGNTRKMKKVFIARANNSVQVYRKQMTMRKQSIPSLWRLIERPEIKERLLNFGRMRFEAEMEFNLPFYTAQLSK